MGEEHEVTSPMKNVPIEKNFGEVKKALTFGDNRGVEYPKKVEIAISDGSKETETEW